jgi:hypothetical protein
MRFYMDERTPRLLFHGFKNMQVFFFGNLARCNNKALLSVFL